MTVIRPSPLSSSLDESVSGEIQIAYWNRPILPPPSIVNLGSWCGNERGAKLHKKSVVSILIKFKEIEMVIPIIERLLASIIESSHAFGVGQSYTHTSSGEVERLNKLHIRGMQ